ncbi:chitin synthase [Synchytrium microbalum]|uniref:chitin synthase n=1 Tax=Synchytrium microbalum TaxID=1806994 RepID=A0A507C6B8_9FUNG|nr:chitin synthase [Synchytrium microbalum]TPX35051.1 chitin synthase [Synchytrium microbalum]
MGDYGRSRTSTASSVKPVLPAPSPAQLALRAPEPPMKITQTVDNERNSTTQPPSSYVIPPVLPSKSPAASSSHPLPQPPTSTYTFDGTSSKSSISSSSGSPRSSVTSKSTAPLPAPPLPPKGSRLSVSIPGNESPQQQQTKVDQRPAKALPVPPPVTKDRRGGPDLAISKGGAAKYGLTADSMHMRSPEVNTFFEATMSIPAIPVITTESPKTPSVETYYTSPPASFSESILETPTDMEQPQGPAPTPPTRAKPTPKRNNSHPPLSPTNPNLERLPSPQRHNTLGRAKSLVRPERHPTIQRGMPREPTATHQRTTRMLKPESDDRPSWWRVMSWVLTCWAIPPLIHYLEIGKKVERHEWHRGVGDIPPPKGQKRNIGHNKYIISENDEPILDKEGKPVLNEQGMPTFKEGKVYEVTIAWSGEVIQAWREKVALCTIVFLLCTVLAFITFGLQTAICPARAVLTYAQVVGDDGYTAQPYVYNIRGTVYDFTKYLSNSHPAPISSSIASSTAGYDISSLFPAPGTSCQSILKTTFPNFTCSDATGTLTNCHTWSGYQKIIASASWQGSSTEPKILGYILYDWLDMLRPGNQNLMVYSNYMLDMSKYNAAGVPFLGAGVDAAIQRSLNLDSSKYLANYPGAGACLTELFMVGYINTMSIGCVTLQIFLYISLVIILALVAVKFMLALYFGWFMSRKLGMLQKRKGPSVIGPSDLRMGIQHVKRDGKIQGGQRIGGGYDTSTVPTPMPYEKNLPVGNVRESMASNSGVSSFSDVDSDVVGYYGDDLYTVLMVACYSEGEEGLRTTMNSLASTIYPDKNKMILVVADGLVKGSGNDKTTPDIVIDMVEMDPEFALPPVPLSYLAIADGAKRHNKAQIYAGWYVYEGHRVATMIIVKCGTAEEKGTAKPGNRGKRDSQLIVMNYFRHAFFDDPIPPLEYDFAAKMTYLTGATPDKFEIILMVDADTKVAPDSLSRMVAVMASDPTVMGLCGETRIMNKAESWVSRIQVFEYYLSHHLNKAFESVFGEVTCLPGCFCMYRIKAPKGDTWVPVLINPDIVEVYSENIVDTLHKKNLLLLGEDRFLTTLMLRAFPTRKLMFVPRAYCKTTVPAEFKVLLSQRRRWINSTIHNLLELVLVRELCGTFCFSMQAVILLELIGTVTLPAAITFTTVLLLETAFSSLTSTAVQWIPLMLLGAILGLPAFLILFTSKRWAYVYWMGVYLLSLHVWNLVLPTYAFWHFDDFSWGQTRQVAGEKAGTGGHGGEGGAFDDAGVQHKLWIEWEIESRRNSKKRGNKQLLPGTPLSTAKTTASNSRGVSLDISRSLSRREVHHLDFGSHMAMSAHPAPGTPLSSRYPPPPVYAASPASLRQSSPKVAPQVFNNNSSSGYPANSYESAGRSRTTSSPLSGNRIITPHNSASPASNSLMQQSLSRRKSSSVARQLFVDNNGTNSTAFVLPPPIAGPSPAARSNSEINNTADVDNGGDDVVYVGVLPVTLQRNRVIRAQTVTRSATLSRQNQNNISNDTNNSGKDV